MTAPVMDLECQDCGETVERITPQMRRAITTNPHAYTVHCAPCAGDRIRLLIVPERFEIARHRASRS